MITMVLGGLWHGAAWTFVLWGALPRRDARAPSTPSTAASGRVLPRGCAGSAPSPPSASAGSCSARPTSTSSGPSSAGSSTGARRRCGRCRWSRWSLVVIGMQLLPPRPVERLQLRIERLRPVALAVGLGGVILIVGATVPSQGVPPVHLLPVLMRRAHAPRRQRDEPLRAPRPAQLQRPRRGRRGRARRRAADPLRRRLDPRRHRADRPRASAATSSTRSAARPSGSPTASRSTRPSTS